MFRDNFQDYTESTVRNGQITTEDLATDSQITKRFPKRAVVKVNMSPQRIHAENSPTFNITAAQVLQKDRITLKQSTCLSLTVRLKLKGRLWPTSSDQVWFCVVPALVVILNNIQTCWLLKRKMKKDSRSSWMDLWYQGESQKPLKKTPNTAVHQQFMSLSHICIPVQSFHDTKHKVHKKKLTNLIYSFKF